ncbi:MAG: hypothetical protein ACRDFZ_02170 [Candidatus Limnocylindria bacterium]
MSQVPDRARPTITTRLGVSLPSAIGALLFAGALAFGSGMIDAIAPLQGGDQAAKQDGPATDGHGDGQKDPQTGKDDPAPYDDDGKDEPDHSRPDKTPVPESTPKPAPVETAKPQPQPAPPAPTTGLSLSVQTGDGKVKLTWSVFGGDGFAYYKLVRSSDATVTWPTGSGDSLVAAISDPNAAWFKDFPSCNTNWYYRVFAVRSGDTGYMTLAASNVATAYTACVVKPTHPPVYQMGFSAEVIDGQVHLTWEQCSSEGFAAYKVVRSQTNPAPTYPLNSGSELIAAIGDPNVTSLVDGNVSSGQTWHYRVLSMANDGSGWYPIGMTPVLTVTIP